MGEVQQTNRLFKLETPLGEGVLLVRSAEGSETVSELFNFKLVLASEDAEIDFNAVIGKKATLGIRQSDGSSWRYFNGYISHFRQAPAPGRLASYYADLVPWVHFLTLSQNCRIFQNKTVPQVVEEVFQKLGYSDYKFRLQGEHTAWEYCTQYRETAFEFVSRLMEIEGMYYFFQQDEGKHTMIIVDHKSAHQPCPYQSEFRYDKVTGYNHGPDTVYHWVPAIQVRPGKYAHKEYNYNKPTDPLYSEMSAKAGGGQDPKHEIYDFPGDYEVRQEGDDWVRLRIEEEENDHQTATGKSNCRSMASGYRFSLTEHDRQDQNRSYLVTKVSHQGQEGTFFGGTDEQQAQYENQFEALSSDAQFRQDRKSPTARMMGSQTALVVGPKGEEIYTDALGRVKVSFHWDRESKNDENSSCWIRVKQAGAGNGFGHIWLPRIGQEVVVDFMEGDPDRPLITGSVYNQDTRLPYKLPDNKTISGIKTRSSLGGGDNNYNEIRLEDKMGAELFVVQAERDMELLVKHDRTSLVKNDENLTILGNQSESITKTRSAQVQGDEQLQVKGKINIEATGSISIKATGRIVLQSTSGISLIGPGGYINISGGGISIEGVKVDINSGLAAPSPAEDSAPTQPPLPPHIDDK